MGLPPSWREYLGYEDILAQVRGWLAMFGVICVAIGLLFSLGGIWHWGKDCWDRWRMPRRLKAEIMKLSKQELACLCRYIHEDVMTRFLPCDGIVFSLVRRKVLYRVSKPASIAGMGVRATYNIQPWVLETLERWPGLKKHILTMSTTHSNGD